MHNGIDCQFGTPAAPPLGQRVRYFVTGCAGFIGSHLTERLLARGHEVVGYDNFSTGRESFLESARASPHFRLVRGDTLDASTLAAAMTGSQLVFHCAANADVRFGLARPRRDLEQNTLATHHVLEAMRSTRVHRIAFTSTGSVYGDAAVIPTPEDAPCPIQTSLYGASKLAAEGLITAYCTGFGFQSHIFRLVSILGERYTHGHVIDFFGQLRADPSRLRVLGVNQVHAPLDAAAKLAETTNGDPSAFATILKPSVGSDKLYTSAALFRIGTTTPITQIGDPTALSSNGVNGTQALLILQADPAPRRMSSSPLILANVCTGYPLD